MAHVTDMTDIAGVATGTLSNFLNQRKDKHSKYKQKIFFSPDNLL